MNPEPIGVVGDIYRVQSAADNECREKDCVDDEEEIVVARRATQLKLRFAHQAGCVVVHQSGRHIRPEQTRNGCNNT